jgi:hypothetical protein
MLQLQISDNLTLSPLHQTIPSTGRGRFDLLDQRWDQAVVEGQHRGIILPLDSAPSANLPFLSCLRIPDKTPDALASVNGEAGLAKSFKSVAVFTYFGKQVMRAAYAGRLDKRIEQMEAFGAFERLDRTDEGYACVMITDAVMQLSNSCPTLISTVSKYDCARLASHREGFFECDQQSIRSARAAHAGVHA